MGFPPWLAIMASIPLINLILLYYVALTPWPRETRSGSPAAAGKATRISDNVVARRAGPRRRHVKDQIMAGPTNAPEPKMDADDLYREDTYSDRKVGTIRVMTPVKSDGSPDPARPPSMSARRRS